MQRRTIVMTALGIGAFVLSRLIANARKGRGLQDSLDGSSAQVNAMSEDSFPASDSPSFTPAA